MRWADELKNTAPVWIAGMSVLVLKQVKVSVHTLVHHCGHEATTERWRIEANPVSPPSPWRKGAMLAEPANLIHRGNRESSTVVAQAEPEVT